MDSAQQEDNPTTSVNPNPRSVGLRPRTIKVDTQEKYCPTIIKEVMFAAFKSGEKEMLPPYCPTTTPSWTIHICSCQILTRLKLGPIPLLRLRHCTIGKG